VDVTEWLGNEQYAYVPYDAPPDGRLTELVRELDAVRLRSHLVVAVDPRRRLDRGSELALRVDPRRVHLFDPDSGEALGRGSGAPRADAAPELQDRLASGGPSADRESLAEDEQQRGADDEGRSQDLEPVTGRQDPERGRRSPWPEKGRSCLHPARVVARSVDAMLATAGASVARIERSA
jgi:hypothetical protein